VQPGRERYMLKLTVAESLVAGRTVVVGNAAHGLHPVAGQGFNLCLRDVRLLADALRPAKTSEDPAARHGDPGDAVVLKRYAENRQADYRKIIGLTDSLVRLFSTRSALTNALLGPLRGLGLGLLDKLPPLKAQLARTTMGL